MSHLRCHDLREVKREAHGVVQEEGGVAGDNRGRFLPLFFLDLLEVLDASFLQGVKQNKTKKTSYIKMEHHKQTKKLRHGNEPHGYGAIETREETNKTKSAHIMNNMRTYIHAHAMARQDRKCHGTAHPFLLIRHDQIAITTSTTIPPITIVSIEPSLSP